MPILALAGILGFLGVALGAFGAHGLESAFKDLPDAAKRLEWWRTAVQYHLWHALLLAALGVWGNASTPAKVAGWLCVAGIVLFSGSLYAMTLSGITKLGMVTPLGGLAFLGAWACVAVAAWKR